MGKLMGKVGPEFNLRRPNISLTTEQKDQLLRRIVELGDQSRASRLPHDRRHRKPGLDHVL